ncbi:serine/threonine-protein kinase [Pseudonocardia charpentierae]|uniref:non-specific serine/threonine protein kinase n=1 Tax=Pseudonocardia charpentierae TaxID=3075545 RepID=A0ABU2NBE4_9PSEU|nr:serine/threonine-protein kinase [Pseudonocardia sp. DSM 45834]MDT0351276.1 serine/threonine-protein kinase [Pseudonocardia sp. DSM 45834]
MEALTALVAGLLAELHLLTADAVCPGGWPWAVSLMGVAVGLLPAAGTAAVAIWRRRIGSRYGPAESVVLVGVGVLACGVLPLLVFLATGRVFAAAAGSGPVPGLTSRQLRDLDSAVCVVGAQSTYLGRGSVAAAFGADSSLRTGLALLALIGLPAVAALCTAASARLALRRGPRWPARFFWLPVLAVAALTTDVPAGSAAHLWLGASAGAFLGMPAVLSLGAPGWAVVHRSVAGPQPAPAGRSGQVVRAPSGSVAPVGGTGTQRRPGGLGDRLAARFAARAPEPVVASHQESGPVAPRPPRPAGGGPTPTLVAPAGTPGAVPAIGANAVPPRPRTGGPARFRLVRRLGQGGFGRVWLAHDARLGHTVALKAAHVRDADTEERIRREAHALAMVRHPHCVQIHDLVPAESDPGLAELDGMVIVMEYVRGESLGELVRSRGTFDDIAAARVWSTIAGALDAAHKRGVLHRDVKPGNIVLDADGQAHLIDFGIARKTGDATLTATGFVLGTPDFLPPEVAAGGRATAESDAWQLAATVGYALCGQPPRGDHTDAVSGLRAAALGGPPTHLPRRSAHLALLRAALDDDPARRPPLTAVHRALDEWLRSVGARPDGPVTVGR